MTRFVALVFALALWPCLADERTTAPAGVELAATPSAVARQLPGPAAGASTIDGERVLVESKPDHSSGTAKSTQPPQEAPFRTALLLGSGAESSIPGESVQLGRRATLAYDATAPPSTLPRLRARFSAR